MTELFREYRRCGNCQECIYGECWGLKQRISYKRPKVNPGWFGCRLWKSTKQTALSLLQTTQRRLK